MTEERFNEIKSIMANGGYSTVPNDERKEYYNMKAKLEAGKVFYAIDPNGYGIGTFSTCGRAAAAAFNFLAGREDDNEDYCDMTNTIGAHDRAICEIKCTIPGPNYKRFRTPIYVVRYSSGAIHIVKGRDYDACKTAGIELCKVWE